MLGFTHLTFALFLEGNTSLINVTLASFGSLFPDIDTFGVLSKVVKNKPRNLKHRGILHTPFVYVVILCIYYFIFGNFGIAPFIVGVFSHLFLDFITVEGIPIFYPISSRKFHIIGFRTGSSVDVSMSFFFLFFFILRLFKLI
ncbi:MAG: metal-dependent hydrolase [Caldisericum sp.]